MNRHKYSQNSQLESLLARLYGRINYERQLTVTPRHFKLRNMRAILGRLGDPHLKYPVIHVAGTKGKGSVTTMIGQILQASGRRAGVYVSPHLELINQRISVEGSMISDDQLAEVLAELEPVCDSLDEEAEAAGHRKLTFFEVTTAAAFLFFEKQNVDAVVLEVGLGGRMDSTNVCQPLVSVITNISLDHTRQLGSTLDKIAFEKAGIIKPGVPVISGALEPEAAEVIAKIAAENGSQLGLLGRDLMVFQNDSPPGNFSNKDFYRTDLSEANLRKADLCDSELSHSELGKSTRTVPYPVNEFGVTGTIKGQQFRIDEINLRLIGEHQRTNAALAIGAIQVLNGLDRISMPGQLNESGHPSDSSWGITDDQIRDGLAEARLAGRTEIILRKPTVVIDIAHNLASIEAMLNAIQELSEWQSSDRRTLILATTRDKDATSMLTPLLAQFDRIVFTKYQNNPRGKAAEELLEIATGMAEGNPMPAADRDEPTSTEYDSTSHRVADPELLVSLTPTEAWDLVAKDLADNDLVCVAGSAFLVAELRPLLMTLQKSQNNSPVRP